MTLTLWTTYRCIDSDGAIHAEYLVKDGDNHSRAWELTRRACRDEEDE